MDETFSVSKLGMLKLLTSWQIISHNGSLDDKLIHEDIECFKIRVNLRIYQRMNETFFVTKSFNWRIPSPSGTMLFLLFSFEIAVVSSVLCFLVSLKFKSQKSRKSRGNIFIFVCLRTLLACLRWIELCQYNI